MPSRSATHTRNGSVALEPGTIGDIGALSEGNHILLPVELGKRFEHFAATLTALLDSSLRGIVLSGGDTAEAVSLCLNARGIRLGGEIVPGVPWGQFIGGRAAGLLVATKSGGFGADDSLVEAVHFLDHHSKYFGRSG